MRVLVTGSSGHLGEALVRIHRQRGDEVVGLDLLASPFTSHVGSLTDRDLIARCMDGVEAVLHTATLHKPHVVTHSRQDFVDTNITGTLNLLEEAASAGVSAFVLTSTTSAFGAALTPPPDEPAAWVTEDLRPVPKNIYGATKTAAEELCHLFHRTQDLPCLVLRTSRFFPEADDHRAMRTHYADKNLKVNELLHRRVDLEDVVSAHLLAIEKAGSLGFARYIISATTPFGREDLDELRRDAPAVVAKYHPDYGEEFSRRSWQMFPSIDRVYVNEAARRELGWRPKYDFGLALEKLRAGEDYRSPLHRVVGSKGYHSEVFEDGPFPV